MKSIFLVAVALAMAVPAMAVSDRETYRRNAASNDLAAYRALDLDRDGRLTREEVRADLNFGPRFDDIDIDRDGVVTEQEMRRYIEQAYDVKAAA